MIKDIKLWQDFEMDLLRNSKPDYQKNLKIFKQMHLHAVNMKAFPPNDPLHGIETKIRISKIINRLG